MGPPPHFNGRSRYDPFPPPHHFPDPNYYPPHPSFPPPPPQPQPPPPPPRHNHPNPNPNRHLSLEHRYHHHPPPLPNENRIYFPYPPDLPPSPPPRVSDRVIIHHHHPHPRDFPPEPWEGEKIRVFDERPDANHMIEELEWDGQEARQDFVPTFRGNSYPSEDRRRYRLREDGILEEDTRGRSHGQQIRFWDSGSRRRNHHHFDQLPPDASLGPSSRNGLVPNKGGEASPPFERRPPPPFERRPPPPNIRSSGHPHPDIGVSERNLALISDPQIGFQGNRSMGIGAEDDFLENQYMGNRGKRKMASIDIEDDGFQENHYIGNKGKRKMFNGGNSQYFERNTMKRPLQKASALGRIQSGISVWNRIEEKPSYFSHNTSRSPPPPLPFSSPGFSDENQQEIGILDLSYKSNNLVAKVVVPSSPATPSSDGKGPKVATPDTRVVKKKKLAKREKVVVSIGSGSGLLEGVPKRPISSSTKKVSSHPEVSEKAVVSSNKPASGSSSQPCPKVTNVASVNKSAVRKPAKTVVLVEGSITEDYKGEDKVTEGRPIDDISPQLCQQGPTVVTPSIENSSAEQSIRDTNLVQGVGFEDDKEEVSVTLGGKIGPNCSSPIVPDMVFLSDAGAQPLAQEEIGIMNPLENGAAEGSCIAVESSEQATLAVNDVGNSPQSDTELVMSSCKESSSSGLVVDLQVMSDGVVTSSSEGNFLKGENVKMGRERLEKQQKLEVATVTKELEILGEGKSENGDVLLHPHMQDIPALLTSEVSDTDTILGHSLPDGASDREHVFSFSGRDGLPQSDYMKIWENSSVVPMTDSMGEGMEQPLAFVLSEEDSSVDMSKVQVAVHFVDAEQSHLQLSDSKGCSDNDHCNNQYEKLANNNDSLLGSKRLLASEAEEVSKSDKTILHHRPLPEKTKLLPSHEPQKQIIADEKITVEEPMSTKTLISSAVPRVFSNRMSLAGSLKETATTSHHAKNRTWHRNNTPSSASPSHGNLQRSCSSSLHKQSPKKLGRIQNSYVRKGNSLIRRTANEVPPPRPSHGPGASSRKSKHVTERSMAFGSKIDRSDRTSCFNPSFERPKTAPLPLGSKMPICSMNPANKDCPHPISENPIPEAGVEAQGKPLESQTFDLLSGSVDNQNITSGKKSEPLNTKRMIYVKCKSNQLVAAHGPDFGDSSTHPTKKVQKLSSFTSSDLYYKRKENKLILNALSSDNQQKQEVINPVDNSTSKDRRASKLFSLKWSTAGVFRKRLDKVRQKTYKHSKFSRVWTLNGEQSCKKGVTSLNRSKILPYLFPWKKTIYCKNSVNNTALISNKHSLSLISRKLQLTRKRDTIYTVSTDGFSLRKARVVSIGGSSLKWSKSIERHSKKASEEATLAVAEVERKKREKKRTTSTGARAKNGNCLPSKSTFGIDLQQGERIFRVGSARYKMDSSKRTLIRIPDGQSSQPIGHQSGNNRQISFVPRRLLIGNDEYIRVGNGNQLVRDPKKLIRILASEKVRWSLHTARLRLARKQQYCQFFTRFGKCNKSAGKCPYLHDPAKVAICTQFLRGVCSDTSCKLTHKIIPERMPDCSYFLQGLCTNINCPYRHVNVNPNAAICDGFLRGYCADGDECRKKHSYVCPLFEATGKCPQGSKCKLHHPKSRNKSKKRKRSEVQSNSRGRYFGSTITEVGAPLVVSSDKYGVEKGGDALCSDGRFADYIRLDEGSDSDGVGTYVPTGSQPKVCDSDLSYMQPDDLDALIKPVRIMNKAKSTNGFISL